MNCAPEHFELLQGLPQVHLLPDDRAVRVAEVGGMATAPIVHFEGVDDRNGAESLRGKTLAAHRDAFPTPAEDEFYVGDFEGVEVRALDGQRIGAVQRVDVLPANAVLTVRRDAGGPELLVPFIKDAVPHVDLEGGHITIDVGFLDV